MPGREVPLMPRTESTSEFQPLEDREVEYFFASDASAVIEHTNRVIYLEVRGSFIHLLHSMSLYLLTHRLCHSLSPPLSPSTG